MQRSHTHPIHQQPVVIELCKKLAQEREVKAYGRELVRKRLMLSEQQLRGLEVCNQHAFYNERMFLRALKKYVQLLQLPTQYEAVLDDLLNAERISRVEREIDQSIDSNANPIVRPMGKQTGHERYLVFSIVVLLLLALLIAINGLRG